MHFEETEDWRSHSNDTPVDRHVSSCLLSSSILSIVFYLSSSSFVFYLSLGDSYDNKLKIFEQRCVDEYLREKNALLRDTQEGHIRVIYDRYN